jgi:hypothetical protein
MSGIRFKPKYIVLPISPEIKKQCFTFHRGRNTLLFCTRPFVIPSAPIPPIITEKIFNGGEPSLAGILVKDGGSPSLSGVKIYDGGKP